MFQWSQYHNDCFLVCFKLVEFYFLGDIYIWEGVITWKKRDHFNDINKAYHMDQIMFMDDFH
jgi:hypothetical protein